MDNKLLLVTTPTANFWLERCHRPIINSLKYLRDERKLWTILKSTEIIHRDYICSSPVNIHAKYVPLLKSIYDTLEVIGLFKEFIYRDTNESVIGIRIYGYDENVNIAWKFTNYIIEGTMGYYVTHVKRLRANRANCRRRIKKMVYHKVDARKQTNQNIDNKLKMLQDIVEKSGCGPSHLKKVYLGIIFSRMQRYEKIDFKQYRNMKNMTMKAATSKKGKVQKNRIL